MRETTLPGVYHHGDAICSVTFTDDNGASIDYFYCKGPTGQIYERGRGLTNTDDSVLVLQSNQFGESTPLPVDPNTLLGASADEVSRVNTVISDLPKPFPIKKRRRKVENIIDLSPFESMEKCLAEVFDKFGLEVLGGTSGENGWTAFSTFQKCPYLFKRIYLDGIPIQAPALEIGIALHALLSVYYSKIMASNYPLTPNILHDELLELDCNQEYLSEAWRVYEAYEFQYEEDYIEPLAVEWFAKDEETGNTARFDLIGRVKSSQSEFPVGTYIFDHKSASRFDASTKEGRSHVGTAQHQTAVYERSGLGHRFGKLQGVILNLCGKQKVPKFHRHAWIFTQRQVNDHRRHLQVWAAQRQLALATNVFPKSRGNCIGPYGACKQWEHCLNQ